MARPLTWIATLSSGLLVGLGTAAALTAVTSCNASADFRDSGTDAAFDGNAGDTSVHQDGSSDSSAHDASADASDSSVQPPPAPSCLRPDEAPLPTGTGGWDCFPVGNALDAASGDGWPATDMALSPIVYVDPSATGTPDGSMAHPYPALEQALAARPDGLTYVLRAGRHVLSATVTLGRTLTLLGAAAHSGTVLVAPSAGTALDVRGASANVTVQALEITGGTSDDSVAVNVSGGGLATLRSVDIEDMAYGVAAQGATNGAHVRADGLSVLRSVHAGVALDSGADAVLKSLYARGGKIGVYATGGAHVNVTEALLADQSSGGVLLTGGVGVGSDDQLDRVAAVGNREYGIALSGAGTNVTGSLWLVTGTVVVQPNSDGDGVLVLDGAQLTLDHGIASDAQRGFGSMLVYNGRAGLVAAGQSSAGDPSTLVVDGADLSDNTGPGVVVQQGAALTEVGYSALERNGGSGLVLSGNSIFGVVKCNAFTANHRVPVAFGATTLTLGDGLDVGYTTAPATSATLLDNHFALYERFPGAFVVANVVLQANTGLTAEAGFAVDSRTMFMGTDPTQTLLDTEPAIRGTEALTLPALATP